MITKQAVVKNHKGVIVTLNALEQWEANYWQKKYNARFRARMNALGYEVSITTLTTIVKAISDQKFFEVAPADYFAIRVGQGAWDTNLTTYRSFDIAGDFETGIINLAGQNARLAQAEAGVDALNIQIFNWAKAATWSIFEMEQAAKSGNWDVVAAKEKSRKKNYDLGIQRIAFLGANGLNGAGGSCLGFLNQAGITVNTTVITKPISSMTTAELKTFCATIIEAYRTNCNRTAWPDRFTIPESDYNGLASQASPDFPIKSTLQLLEEMFKVITRNPGFKILPLAYCDSAYSGFSFQQYVLSRTDEESYRMDLPLPYTNTLANSLDNFQFQNTAYCQFTGGLAYRPLEMMYFQYTPS